MDNQFIEEPKCTTERFVEALSLETQTNEIKWRFQEGHGTPAKCICEGRELTIIPDYSDPDQDGYTLYSAAIDGTDSCMLMSAKGVPSMPNRLRNLYEDIVEASKQNPEPALAHMESFIKKSAEKQCLYSIIDAVKLLHCTITTNLKDVY